VASLFYYDEFTKAFSKLSCVRIISLFLYSNFFWIGRNVEDAMRDVGGGGEREVCVGLEEDD
jgi:hypothetical protein